MNTKRAAGVVCAAVLGLASASGVAACGEERGGVEVQGGTTATSGPGTTPSTTAP